MARKFNRTELRALAKAVVQRLGELAIILHDGSQVITSTRQILCQLASYAFTPRM